jgi:hypothetical protein
MFFSVIALMSEQGIKYWLKHMYVPVTLLVVVAGAVRVPSRAHAV